MTNLSHARKQKQIWEIEHRTSETIPSLASSVPYKGVAHFADFLNDRITASVPHRLLDIGCGKGRNSVYMAKQRFIVYGIDYVKGALDALRAKATKHKLGPRIHLYNMELDSKWPFKDDFFGSAIDCFSSIDIETKKGRMLCRDEMFRTLKPGGFAFVSVVSADDEMERELMAKHPGPEKNSVIWPNGKFQKDYSENELAEFYSDFKILEIKKVQSAEKAFKLGRKYRATNFWLILQKPIS